MEQIVVYLENSKAFTIQKNWWQGKDKFQWKWLNHENWKRNNWSLSNCNGTRTHNYFVCKRTLNHLGKLTKPFSQPSSQTGQFG